MKIFDKKTMKSLILKNILLMIMFNRQFTVNL